MKAALSVTMAKPTTNQRVGRLTENIVANADKKKTPAPIQLLVD